MSWDILPKSNLQYFLTKLKGIFDNKVDKETGKGLFSGSYNDLTNKPTIPAAQVNSDWNASSGVAQILNKPTIPAAQVNSDWNASSGVAQILNKPTITDDKVKQTPVSNSSNYEVLFSGTADNVERTEGAKKSNLLRFNPNVGTLWATNVSASKLAYVNNTCFKSSNPPATMAVVEVPTVSGQLALLKPVSEAEYAALSQAEKTNGTIYFRYEANGIMREIQDNGSATSLTSGALPTGQTIESYLNSNIVNKLLFGGNSYFHLKSGNITIDNLINEIYNSHSNVEHYFSCDHKGYLYATGTTQLIGGNRQLIFGFINGTNTFDWYIAFGFDGNIAYGNRANASTFTSKRVNMTNI